MSIEILPDDIINQIAAGEVIENPSAVVKELIENSIDAGADNIEIELEQSGLKKIVISDNGVGIPPSDLPKAALRHATSKIKSFNDLYNINTMGFRGEALASIFSVAKTKIISKTKDKSAYEISSENLNVKESAGKSGTTIFVEDIFYNTPARKKYLKSENQELKSILDIVNRFEVYYHNIKITLKHNGKILINKPKFNTEEENLYYVLGKELKSNLISFIKEKSGIKLFGFIGKPSEITYSFRKNQYLYVNSRYVKSKLIRDAMYEGFGTNLMEGRHPFFTIFIEIDPEVIDVNVHPTKIEIKFENELEIYDFIRTAIKEIFQKTETFKPFEPKKEKDIELNKHIEEIKEPEFTHSSKIESKTYFSKETQTPLNLNEISQDYINHNSSFSDNTSLQTDSPSQSEVYGPLYETLKEYRIVGQINKTFIILETPKEMIIVDQHVAEEKFFFETFKQQIESSNVKSQSLLKPEIINLTTQEMLLYKDYLNLVKKLGFKTEQFGSNEILVREVPININKQVVSASLLKDILHEITVDKKFKNLEKEKIEKLASMSCKRSIKGGDELTSPQIHTMIENLKKLKEPFNCPHGRPILLKYTFTELEKRFKRIV